MSTHSAARTQGVHHAGLTAPDLEAAQSFFQDALGRLELIAPA